MGNITVPNYTLCPLCLFVSGAPDAEGLPCSQPQPERWVVLIPPVQSSLCKLPLPGQTH